MTEAAGCGDMALQARVLVALGDALVHAVRDRDEEGTVVLHEAIVRQATATTRSEVSTIE